MLLQFYRDNFDDFDAYYTLFTALAVGGDRELVRSCNSAVAAVYTLCSVINIC